LAGQVKRGTWKGRDALAWQLLSDDPQANIKSLLDALHAGATEAELAGAVCYAAALRIAKADARCCPYLSNA